MLARVRLGGCLVAAVMSVGCASAADMALTQKVELPELGFVMDYPAGWRVDAIEAVGVAVVSQNKADLAGGMASWGGYPSGKAGGYEVWFQRISRIVASNGVDIQAPGGAKDTPRGMIPLAKLWGYKLPPNDELRDVVVAGLDAVVAELAPPLSASLFYVAFAGPGKDVYILRLLAPTTKELERFKPTWEKMLASIKFTKP